jgi:hypothetical protein
MTAQPAEPVVCVENSGDEAAGLAPAELLALPEDALLARLRPTRPAPVPSVSSPAGMGPSLAAGDPHPACNCAAV